MRMWALKIRFRSSTKSEIQSLQKRYFQETGGFLPYGAAVRALVDMGLRDAAQRKATDVLPDDAVKAALVRKVEPK